MSSNFGNVRLPAFPKETAKGLKRAVFLGIGNYTVYRLYLVYSLKKSGHSKFPEFPKETTTSLLAGHFSLEKKIFLCYLIIYL